MEDSQAAAISREPSVPSLRQGRRFSLKEAIASDKLLTALETTNVVGVLALLSKLPDGVTSALNTPSLLMKHKLRTPLMAAAGCGDFAKWTVVLEAFDQQFENKVQRNSEMRMQLKNKDRHGMTLAMLGARSGNVAIAASVMAAVEQTEARAPFEARDYNRMSLLMHSASVGPAPVFQEVYRTLKLLNEDDKVLAERLVQKSSDDQTILMHAARSGDPMLLKLVSDECVKALEPQTIREMVVERDSDGLNLLMHAASCGNTSHVPVAFHQEGAKSSNDEAGGEGGNRETSDNVATDHATDDSTPPSNATLETKVGDSATITTAENDQTTRKAEAATPTASSKSSEDVTTTKDSDAKIGATDAAVVPVFKIAITLVKELLWKYQVYSELTAVDLWGRSVLTHALLSGHAPMFEAALAAVRDDVLDVQVSEMLETNEGEREDAPMIKAVAEGAPEMKQLLSLRVSQLKKDLKLQEKASSVGAKIESFIPGKLVVLFQALRPQIKPENQLYLLYIMCALAPLFALAASIAQASSIKTSINEPRPRKISILLGVPAMFFWGVGTSNIGQNSALGWSESLSSTAMAAATVIIPGIDSFLHSESALRLGDKIWCNEWRFNCQAYSRWRKAKKDLAAAAREHRSSDSAFASPPALSLQEARSIQPATPSSNEDLPSSYSTFAGGDVSPLQAIEEGGDA